MATDEAEKARLRRALETGPWRRMREARGLGLGLERGDRWQARQYTLLLEALEHDSGDTEAVRGMDEVGTDVLALDRIERGL
jgi:hypothetical protein